MKGRQIDHIVLAVPDLEQTTKDFKDKYKIDLVYGGKHQSFATRFTAVPSVTFIATIEDYIGNQDRKIFSSNSMIFKDLAKYPTTFVLWLYEREKFGLYLQSISKMVAWPSG